MNEKKISVVISAFNEEDKIEACLVSVAWADEIIFIDNTSTDRTSEIAGNYTKKIFKIPNNLMLNKNKNFGFEKASGNWILSLDADERVLPELRKEIEDAVNHDDPEIAGYWIPRKNIIFGQWIQNSIWWPDYQLRLFRKGKGKFPEVHVHEMMKVDGETRKMHEPMQHENYSSISQFIRKMDTIYTENEAENLIKSGKELHWSEAIRMPVGDFLKTFFMQKGYKDGLHGLALSILQAFYAELVFLKVWENRGFEKVNNKHFLTDVHLIFQKLSSEFRYWYLSSLIDESKNSAQKLLLRLMRKKESGKN